MHHLSGQKITKDNNAIIFQCTSAKFLKERTKCAVRYQNKTELCEAAKNSKLTGIKIKFTRNWVNIEQ